MLKSKLSIVTASEAPYLTLSMPLKRFFIIYDNASPPLMSFLAIHGVRCWIWWKIWKKQKEQIEVAYKLTWSFSSISKLPNVTEKNWTHKERGI